MTTAQPTLATYIRVYLLLLLGLAATVGLAYLNLGALNVAGMLAVAFGKAAMVVLIFMHVRYSPKLTWLAVIAGLVWFAILIAFVLSDYQTRGWIPPREPAALALPADDESFEPPRESDKNPLSDKDE